MIYDDRNKGIIKNLHYVFAFKVNKLLEELGKEGIEILIYSGLRTAQEQQKMYESSLKWKETGHGSWQTDLPGGYSYHNYGLAIDFVPVDDEGGTLWNDYYTFRKVGKIAKLYGIDQPFPGRDIGHLQFTGGLTIKDLRNGKEPVLINKVILSPSAIIRSLERGIKRSSGAVKKMLENKLKRLLSRLRK